MPIYVFSQSECFAWSRDRLPWIFYQFANLQVCNINAMKFGCDRISITAKSLSDKVTAERKIKYNNNNNNGGETVQKQ